MKPLLRFTKDKKFSVLQLSDIQEFMVSETRDKSFNAMRALLDRIRPDLVMLGGDNCDEDEADFDNFTQYVSLMAAPMEERGIPWMHVFGNHDHDLPFDEDVKMALYMAQEHCISQKTPGISRSTNYMIPLMSPDGEHIAFALWALDSGNRPDGERAAYAIAPNVWDTAHFDQLIWYYETSKELEAREGHKVPGLLFQHIPPYEFELLLEQPTLCETRGYTEEKLNHGYLNNGLLMAILERGDVRGIACGHCHADTFQGKWNDILMTMDGSAGYAPYGEAGSRGGRLFEIGEDGSIETRFCPYDEVTR